MKQIPELYELQQKEIEKVQDEAIPEWIFEDDKLFRMVERNKTHQHLFFNLCQARNTFSF